MAWSGEFDGFDWDEGNSDKSRRKHGVTIEECEQVFSNIPLLLLDDLKHSKFEERFIAMGKTDAGKMLFVVFTPRQSRVRVISARPMDRKERTFYEESTKEDSEV
ncbi:MAG: BrnT family toxin [Patescibacteria group bacterium]|nr:BrnT family toxin [Patescibacteria group bacterium]